MNRRQALRCVGRTIATGVLASASRLNAAEPPTSGLGIVVYALGVRHRWMKARDSRQNLFEPLTFLDYCRGLGAGGIQLPLGVLAPDACERLRSKAAEHGMFIEGIANPPFEEGDLQRFEAEIQTATRVGALAVRTVILPGRRYEQFKSLADYRQYAERGRRALQRALPIVEKHQARLAVENHKDQRLDERLSLLQSLDSPFVGACVDVGNSFALLEDPLSVVKALAPYACSVHLKDQALQECDEGFLLADVALGEGFLPLEAMVNVLQGARPEVRFSLESITRDPLLVPCLADSYWPTFPDMPARDLANTLRIVRDNAKRNLPQVDSLSLDERAAIEATNVAKSLQYARNNLDL